MPSSSQAGTVSAKAAGETPGRRAARAPAGGDGSQPAARPAGADPRAQLGTIPGQVGESHIAASDTKRARLAPTMPRTSQAGSG